MLSFVRRSVVLSAVASLLLSAAPSVLGQVTYSNEEPNFVFPAGCSKLLGDVSLADYKYILGSTYSNGIQAIGYFTTDPGLDVSLYKEFVFQYSVPDQSGTDNTYTATGVDYYPIDYASQDNHLKFAVYTNLPIGQDQQGGPAGDGSNTGAPYPVLVAQSAEVTLPAGKEGVQTFVKRATLVPGQQIMPNTQYTLAVWNELPYYQFVDESASQYEEIENPAPVPFGAPFPSSLNAQISFHPELFPVTYLGCLVDGVGDPVFTGFNGEKFVVKGLAERIYNVLSLPSLQLNTRFISLTAGQALNRTEQASIRQRQSRLIAALAHTRGAGAGAGAANRLPSTTSWSHDGLYMADTGVQLAGHKLYVQPGAFIDGFRTVQLDGADLPVSSEPVVLLDGSTILRSSSSVLEVTTADVLFTLVNSDHFLNIHSAVLLIQPTDRDTTHVDGLLGQTVAPSFHVERTKAFQQHVENDFLLSEGEDVWSTNLPHNQYVSPASAI